MDGRIEFYWTIPTYITLIMGFYLQEAHMYWSDIREGMPQRVVRLKKNKKNIGFSHFFPTINQFIDEIKIKDISIYKCIWIV